MPPDLESVLAIFAHRREEVACEQLRHVANATEDAKLGVLRLGKEQSLSVLV